MLGNVLLAKCCKFETRGTMFAVAGVLGSIAIAVAYQIA